MQMEQGWMVDVMMKRELCKVIWRLGGYYPVGSWCDHGPAHLDYVGKRQTPPVPEGSAWNTISFSLLWKASLFSEHLWLWPSPILKIVIIIMMARTSCLKSKPFGTFYNNKISKDKTALVLAILPVSKQLKATPRSFHCQFLPQLWF